MAYNTYQKTFEQPKNNNYALEYKDHDEFFTKFYELRTKFIFFLSQQAKSYSLEGMENLYVSLHDLVEWTCNYISYEEIDKKMKIIDEDLNKLSKIKIQITQSQLDPIFNKLKSVWRTISKNHTQNELIPKVQVQTEEDDPFKEETKTSKKLMYKVVMKLFENV